MFSWGYFVSRNSLCIRCRRHRRDQIPMTIFAMPMMILFSAILRIHNNVGDCQNLRRKGFKSRQNCRSDLVTRPAQKLGMPTLKRDSSPRALGPSLRIEESSRKAGNPKGSLNWAHCFKGASDKQTVTFCLCGDGHGCSCNKHRGRSNICHSRSSSSSSRRSSSSRSRSGSGSRSSSKW